MPFIDLNNQNQSSTQPVAVNQSVPQASSSPVAVQQQQSPQTQITTDPTTGIREIRGADFPEQSSTGFVSSPVEQMSAQPQMEMQAQVPAQSQTQPPQSEVVTQEIPQMTQDSQLSSPVESEVPQAMTLQQQQDQQLQPQSQQQVQPEAQPEPQPQPQPINVIDDSQTELIVGTNNNADQTQSQNNGLPTLPLMEQSEQAIQQELPQMQQVEQEQQQPNDVLDRTLPKLDIKRGPDPSLADSIGEDGIQSINKLKLAEEVSELKTEEEKLALESKRYELDDLLRQTVQLGASDLHLTAGYRAMARVDGKLEMIKSQELTHDLIYGMLERVVAPAKHVSLKDDKDIDVSYELPDKSARFRVNVGYQRGTMNATFRLIPKHIRTPEELRLPAVVKEFTKYKQGLVLVTGPTGSGKSTTLASLVNTINLTEPSHIITIEDPIEYTYPRGRALVDQRAVHIDTDSWSQALRAALRQDPDVVLIGEMRDVETMEAALQVAETGHLVFSTLHTNTAAQTIDRIIDAFPEDKQSQVRTQLSSTLMAVQSQRLLPVAGGGRRLAAEVMIVTSGIRNAIREGKVFQIDNMIQTGAELGMVTMEKSLAQLVREGQISTEMAQRFANKPEDVLSLLGRK